MSRLVLTAGTLLDVRKALLAHKEETCAILFGRSIAADGRLTRIVVRESVHPSQAAYTVRKRQSVELDSTFVAEMAGHARRTNQSVIFVHTHPFGGASFSEIDDRGEKPLAEFLNQRVPDRTHASLLITPEASVSRVLGQHENLAVVGVGREVLWGDHPTGIREEELYDRQIRVIGKSGQARLESLRVGIVGLGGTGSVVFQQLLHLGVRDFVLIDPDVIEKSNLNRVVGASEKDIGRPKTSVAAAWASDMGRGVAIASFQESVLVERSVLRLVDTDFVFCCTDSHGSRAVLNQLAYQYLVPVIDLGVAIAPHAGFTRDIVGRIQMLAPGLPCLVCGNFLDPEQVRRDLLTDFERQKDPYIIGHHDPAPAVISINSVPASLAVTMFLNAAAELQGHARLLNYDAVAGSVRAATAVQHPACVVCSSRGALARADEWPLPARQD